MLGNFLTYNSWYAIKKVVCFATLEITALFPLYFLKYKNVTFENLKKTHSFQKT